jgi:S1-C subfamily serine protease
MTQSEIESKYKYKPGVPVQLKNQFYGVFKGIPSGIKVIFHKTLDLALVKIEGDVEMLASEYPLFSETEVEVGLMLCKLGYPFSEYTCVAYDETADDILFTQTGKLNSPYFPLDGMVTRKIGNGEKVIGFEMSTPGIKGQSGGPVFDEQGVVYGMQSGTKSHDLDLRMKKSIQTMDGPIDHTTYAFLNVGVVISSIEIIKFLQENNVKHRVI